MQNRVMIYTVGKSMNDEQKFTFFFLYYRQKNYRNIRLSFRLIILIYFSYLIIANIWYISNKRSWITSLSPRNKCFVISCTDNNLFLLKRVIFKHVKQIVSILHSTIFSSFIPKPLQKRIKNEFFYSWVMRTFYRIMKIVL